MQNENQNEIKKNKQSNYNFKLYEVIIIVILTCLLSFFAGSSIMELKYKRNENPINSKLNKTDSKYIDEFINNYNYINENYYQDIDKETLINGAIEGMMNSISDPYSVYMPDEEYSNFNIILDGAYNGVGLEVIKNDDGTLLILNVFKNSPAFEAGIVAGDIIVTINNIDVKQMSASEFSQMIVTGKDKNYKLQIIHNNQLIEYNLTKNNIYLTSVLSKTFEVNNNKIGYIYVSIFAANTAEQFKQELVKLENDNITSLIIDVRGNNGGYLTIAESIASMFVDKKHVIYQLKKNNKIVKQKSTGNVTKKYSIVILTDNSSASAAELLTGSLKDNLNATIIGETTYGKGTVQELMVLSNGDKYKITTKEWLTPKGTSINKVGIKPDIEVKLQDLYYTNPIDQNDNQLQTAIEYLAN